MKGNLSRLLISIIASTVIAVVILSHFGNYLISPSSPGTRPDSLYSAIRSAGVVRAAYIVGAPVFMMDPNTKQKSGIFYDIVVAAAQKLGLTVDWNEEVGYGQMLQGLNSHRYDIVGAGVWVNADRARTADFSIPLYYDAVFAYVRVADTRFDQDLSILNSPTFTISTMDGELGAAIAKADYPSARTLELPQSADFTQLILNVISRKADIVFLSAAGARAYQAVRPKEIRAVNPKKPLRIFANAIVLPQGQYTLKQAFDYAFTEMLNDGEVDAILRRYEKVPGSFLRVAPPFQVAPAEQ